MPDCVFCDIVAGRVPAKVAYQDAAVVAFHDIRPMAPVHVLVVPRKHVTSLMTERSPVFHGMVVHGIQKTAEALGLTDFSVHTNVGPGARQTVEHLHWHLKGEGGVHVPGDKPLIPVSEVPIPTKLEQF